MPQSRRRPVRARSARATRRPQQPAAGRPAGAPQTRRRLGPVGADPGRRPGRGPGHRLHRPRRAGLRAVHDRGRLGLPARALPDAGRWRPVPLVGFAALGGDGAGGPLRRPARGARGRRGALPGAVPGRARRARTTDGATVAIAGTLLGIYWIGFAFAHAVLLRQLHHGNGVVIDVLVGTFLGDTGAYLGGRLFGRRPLAPAISPNKTVEGLFCGMLVAILAVFFAGLYQAWLTQGDALLLGVARGGARAARRPVRVRGQARRRHQGHRQPVRPPRRRARSPRRGDLHDRRRLLHLGRRRRADRAARLPWARPTIAAVPRRLAILGSTGSIGVQALDVVARAGAGRAPGRGARAPRAAGRPLLDAGAAARRRRVALADPDAAARAAEVWTEGEVLSGPDGLVELITEARCDLVLNAIVGSAGLVPTVATLGRGDRPRAGQQGVAGGGRRARHRSWPRPPARRSSRSTPSTRRCTSCSPASGRGRSTG